MAESKQYPIPVASDDEIAEFVARFGTPYNAETDEYHREPFVADIREGKNDPIYNAHSYHTKVPPRAIIPYILHYTEPGDIILDPFCGSGMTGVAALMCENPPEDMFQSVPCAKKGTRRALLNDLSPAACHIAYNYCTPVDVNALRTEFDRLRTAVKDEFDWLYGTEHYQPAIGDFDPSKADIASRLKNPPANIAINSLLAVDERNWELLDRAEVERRMGPQALAKQPLQADVDQFILIPALIQFTIWSDVYRCQGMVTSDESTGRTNKRTGKPISRQVRRPRGCGAEFVLWDVAVDFANQSVRDVFFCPNCNQEWKKAQIPLIGTTPVVTNYSHKGPGDNAGRKPSTTVRSKLIARPTTATESAHIQDINSRPIPYWFPTIQWEPSREMWRGVHRDLAINSVADFYTRRNLWALASAWEKVANVENLRLRSALRLLLTSISGRYAKTTRYLFGKGGNAAISGTMYVGSFTVENSLPRIWTNKWADIVTGFQAHRWPTNHAIVINESATAIPAIPNNSIDYVFADPPFGSNIFYSDCSILWESWLGSLTHVDKEAVWNKSRKPEEGGKTLVDYAFIMSLAFAEMYRVLKPGRFATVEFNNSDGQVFEAIKDAARKAGFAIENMVFLDKVQKTFKQLKGEKGEEDVVGHDVIFNLRKPASVLGTGERAADARRGDTSKVRSQPNYLNENSRRDLTEVLEPVVGQTIHDHLRTLPDRIRQDPKTYTEEHRTTPFLNTMLMNALIPKGIVDVSKINLPFIEKVCQRFFRRVDNRWYLRDETVGNHKAVSATDGFFPEPDEAVVIENETSAIEWLRQRLAKTPMRIGELRPHWMRATVQLTSDVSTRLEQFLREHFWLDRKTNRWREPTETERSMMDTTERLQARHDAERFLAGHSRRHPTDDEVVEWIDHIYHSASLMEDEAAGLSDTGIIEDLPEEAAKLYGMMPRLFQGILKEHVDPAKYALAQRQCRIAATKNVVQAEQDKRKADSEDADGPTLFSCLEETDV